MIKHLLLLEIQNMMNINVNLLQWLINFLIKRTSGRTVKNEIISKKEIVEELQKPIIRTFTKRKVHLFFIDSIWCADLQLISEFNRGCSYLLCDIDIITNMHGFFLYKLKKELQLLMVFKKF